MFGRIVITMTLLGLAQSASAKSYCEFQAERSLTLDAAGLSELRLAARAGDLRVIGEASATSIELRGRACASSQILLDEVQLVDSRNGATQSVEVRMPEISGGWGSRYANLDLQVSLPSRLMLSVDDSSGDIEIAALAAVDVHDSSGDVRIRSIAGAVTVEDSSGDIDVSDIVGDVLVTEDSSGDIRIEKVQGTARVLVDSSGEIALREISGDALVGSDSSGDITMERIDGSAEVRSDGSGSIRARDVRGDFRVGSDRSGDISHANVGGQVSVPSR